jgi:hypothetical protein
MTERIIRLELEGKVTLGFDTGLSSQAFAQAKFAQSITQEGLIVYPDERIDTWQASGVVEYRNGEDPTMVVWGPDFPGERLDLLIADPARRDEALEALSYWIAARSVLGEDAVLWPAGALVVITAKSPRFPRGTILFSPERLVARSIQAEGEDRWLAGVESPINPELGQEAVVFTAGALLYRVLAGQNPFPNRDKDLLHQDIREGVFLPLRFAAPGLDGPLAELIDKALAASKSSGKRNSTEGERPSLRELGAALGPTGPKEAASFFHPLDELEQTRLAGGRAQFEKKRNLTVNTRRFVIRNSAILGGSVVAFIAVILVVNSIIAARKDLPTTKGMEPVQVIETYYNAFGELDHTLMDACVTNKAGKRDIEMVTNFFVLSRVRQAYESIPETMISARKWQERGSVPVATQVFGVTDLDIRRIGGDEDTGEVRYRAAYKLWLPAELSAQDLESPTGQQDSDPPDTAGSFAGMPLTLPQGHSLTDELTLVRRKDDWHIVALERDGYL